MHRHHTLKALAAAFLLLGFHAIAHSDDMGLQAVIASARTQVIAPHKALPKWFDWQRAHNGLAFYAKHKETIDSILASTSLVSTYACKDITPVLVKTGRLVDDYNQRIDETGHWIQEMLKNTDDQRAFLGGNYKRAFELGEYHFAIGRRIKPESLGWNPAERRVLNQQAFGFVLYSFAWQPLEVLQLTREVNAKKDSQAIDDWLYLWRLFGYAMGVEEPLLPTDAAVAKAIVAGLRKAQYAAPGESAPQGVPTLLKNEILYLARAIRKGEAPDDASKAKALKLLAQAIFASPGLSRALGLGANPGAGLQAIMDAPKAP